MPTNTETSDTLEVLRAELDADPHLSDEERQQYLANALDAEWREHA